MGGSVIWHVATSLDGYIAAPDGDVGWVFGHDFPGREAETTPGRIGAIIAGRVWHDECAARDWDVVAPYHGQWSGPIFVLTHRPPDASPLPVTFLTADINLAIRTARDAACGKDVGLFGADIPRQALEAGLLDEIIVHIIPVLLGGGRRLCVHDGPPIRLVNTHGKDHAAATLVLRPEGKR
ncbi:MAG: dihydrofolate reductase family protein [Rhodobacteraceae bacterium]|nr:dihydrofolate reductase family protein [Paracoccaceae bacterium]